VRTTVVVGFRVFREKDVIIPDKRTLGDEAGACEAQKGEREFAKAKHLSSSQ